MRPVRSRFIIITIIGVGILNCGSLLGRDLSGLVQTQDSEAHETPTVASALTDCSLNLLENPPDYYDLKKYQTSVKDQGFRGACGTFAFVGALEATYVKKYGFNPQAFDLSEEYFIHIVHSTRSTYKSSLKYESNPSFCTMWDNPGPHSSLNPAFDISGEPRSVIEGLYIPEERYAPFFDDTSPLPDHREADFYQIGLDSGLLISDPNAASKIACNPNRTQKNVDDFEYDTRRIPTEARKNAIYGATQLLWLSTGKARDTAYLEKLIYSGYAVGLGMSYRYIDCGPADKSNPDFVYSDNNYKCKYPVNNVNANAPHHWMVVIGYDRLNKYFLFKSSWGSSWDYEWLPYDFVRTVPDEGYVIVDVRDPNLGPSKEAMWIGKWAMDHDGWLGNLTIRRTTKSIGNPPSDGDLTCLTRRQPEAARLGSYEHDALGTHEVTGNVGHQGTNVFLIDFDHVEGPPNSVSDPIDMKGQVFWLQLFGSDKDSFTFGNFIAGETDWNELTFGALLSRPEIARPYTKSTFDVNAWKDKYRLYSADGNRETLQVKDIGPATGGVRAVKYAYNFVNGEGFLAEPELHKLESGGDPADAGHIPTDLFYHTHESNFISGLGVFGISVSKLGVTDVSASNGLYLDKVSVTWSSVEGAQAYKVSRKTLNGSYQEITGEVKTTKYDDKQAVPGEPYYYCIKTLGQDGTWIGCLNEDIGYRKLNAPTGVSASDGLHTDKVVITWKPVQGSVVGYTIYRQTDKSSRPMQVGGTDTTEFNDFTATSGMKYLYSVKAESYYGSSDFSASNSGFRKLAAPTNVNASDADALLVMNKVIVSWSGVNGATSYTVYRGESVKNLKSLSTVSTSSFEDNTGTPELVYYYAVRANNSYGSSDLSAADQGHRKLSPPTGVQASDGSYSDRVKITWSKVNGVSGYEIYRADDVFGTKTLLGNSSTESFDDKTAKLGSFYFYWVRSKNKHGVSDYCEKYDWGYRTLPLPTGVSASKGTYSDKVRITWNPVQGAAQYLIYRSTSASGGMTCIDGSIPTTYDDTTAVPGTKYYYWVQALYSFQGFTSDYSSSDSGWRKQ